MKTFTYPLRVEFAHTDMAGITHFSEFSRYMEQVECAFVREVVPDLFTPEQFNRWVFPRKKASFEFFAPLHFNDVFEGQLHIAHLGGSSVQYHVDFKKADTLVAIGEMLVISCSRDPQGNLAAKPIPQEYRVCLAPFVASHDGS